MDLNEALEKVRPYLKQVRFEHTKRVVDTAVKLSEYNDVDLYKTEIAAAFHDLAKYWPRDEMKRIILQEEYLPKDLLHYHHELWHGPVGAYLVKHKYGIEEQDILDSIRYHTTGRANMGRLEKIVFLADYIEPGRDFPGINEVRDMAWNDLDKACLMSLQNTIQFLMSKGATIYPDTFQAYNDFTQKLSQ
ncbi:putative HD superfamily hydrolase of NAD metabolism [Salinibacillus kushneri]|uniref:bis(5'-nucleosyl)-tetraphosphatase (symmetrical) n=1 Tax=Salinibacillus kushneri TaxID=237682 RepID=A0A1I0G4A6_9BACI|nr:bis(5'-nucleosyl)-tetraphosphatase (symmetrical) YqeK [Salinibacillus kushneri]SET65455.1 putative HD superfamily hydrolase of NAD metabolism [Salinibacillus kushneri]